MLGEKTFFTSESVTEGHPDKICDQISDGILDAVLKDDPNGACCCEVFITTGLVVVGGEITTKAQIDIPAIVRETLKEIGYTRADYGIDYKSCGVVVAVDKQSPDIAQGEIGSTDKAQGAGDQGMIVGYACRETKQLMPLPITLAHALTRKLAMVRKNKVLSYLRPDGKSQVTVEYESGKPKRIDTVLVSAQHDPAVPQARMKKDIINKIIKKVLPKRMLDKKTKFLVNPTGRFVIGGPQGDTGLTGRKIIVDTYGGAGAHGGGAFSGKDPTKVDRSASYYARYAAKNIVASGVAKKAEVRVAYAIGVPEPLMLHIDAVDSQVSKEALHRAVSKLFDFRPGMIIKELRLRRPIYRQTASYGHFGRTDLDLPWERVDKAAALRKLLK